MTKNWEVFATDPRNFRLPNDGVAKFDRLDNHGAWAVLSHELRSFVWTGGYKNGVERVLGQYLANLGRTGQHQPSVWVSGFYGSGKSQFVRVLQHLWCDTLLEPEGVRARDLLRLPEEIRVYATELSGAGRREGGLWSAAGTLSAGSRTSAKLAFLSIIFRAAGLPEKYAQARLMLYLRTNGHEEKFLEELRKRGKDVDALTNMGVSPEVHNSLMTIPGFGDSPQAVKDALKQTYPNVADIAIDDLLMTLRDVFNAQSNVAGRIPLALIILDELQQFIDDNNSRMLDVQEIIQAVQGEFQRRVLIVATGQSQLTATPVLRKLKDRFSVLVHLEDVDVEEVLRQVVLPKDQSRKAELDEALEIVSGEISRELNGSRIGPTAADSSVLAADYPVLPARRRLWEALLRALDSGVSAHLRNQLRITHEAVQFVADRDLGTVVAIDFLYDQQRGELTNSGRLLRDVDLRIQRLRQQTGNGLLKARICSAVYLVNQLPEDPATDLGIRATAGVVADLLVEDLAADGPKLRAQLPALLEELVSEGLLQETDGRYQLQTPEGQEWQADFISRHARIRSDDSRIAVERASRLKAAIQGQLGKVAVLHGTSKTPRKTVLSYGDAAPSPDTSVIQYWVRDGWSTDERTVKGEAAAKGSQDPTVHVFIPNQDAEALKAALINFLATSEVVQTRPIPTSDEGRNARKSMESRLERYARELEEQISALCRAATVYRGGGGEVSGTSLRERLVDAGSIAADRMFSDFKIVDSAAWDSALRNTLLGKLDALKHVNWTGEVREHPAAKKLLMFIGAGQRGQDVLKHFEGAPFGWPKDAVATLILLLLRMDVLVARLNGTIVDPSTLTAGKLGALDLRNQTISASVDQKMAFRRLAQVVGRRVSSGEEAGNASTVLQAILDLAAKAGGEAPLPPRPDVLDLQEFLGLTGVEQVVRLAENHVDLSRRLKLWNSQAELASGRLQTWRVLERLAAVGTPGGGDPELASKIQDVRVQIQAISTNRSLLDAVDPVARPLQELASHLRLCLKQLFTQYEDALNAAIGGIEASALWPEIPAHDREAALKNFGLVPEKAPGVGTTVELVTALELRSLAAWVDRIDAVPTKAQALLGDLARRLEPSVQTVVIPKRTLHTAEDVNVYVEQLRTLLTEQVAISPVLPS
ncbi:BREX system P-loop protein BrxC [Nonomuraea sp. LPB2021202275-12-8]|uniref:BREX system P-loop protein BrxC n=1 Tax=Nonomuraea sp. LPB2021202275-12-8 TaxID=3120159 RepID=UPI00300CDE2E